MKRAALLLALAAAGPALAAATPDGAVADCRRPGSATERAVCASPFLQAADQDLAVLAAEWRRRVPDAAQTDWLRRRDRMCAPAQRPDCLEAAYAERAAWLRERLAALPPELLPAVTAAPPAAAPLAAPVPAPPPAVAVVSLAARLAAAPCGTVGSGALREQGWRTGDAPFGTALSRWSQPDFAALMRRARECQAENADSARDLQRMLVLLNGLRGGAPERPAVPPMLSPAPEPLAGLDCADPALLQDVAFTAQATPALTGGAPIRRLLRPRPYADVITEAYSTTPALRAEFQRLRPLMAAVPQCLVEAETTGAVLTLSYRLYAEAGRMLVEVQRLP